MTALEEMPLGELVEIEDSRRIPLNSTDRAERPGPYPYYGAAKIFDYIDGYIYEGDRILVGEDGSVVRPDGRPYVQHAAGRFWVNNHAHVLRPVDGVDFHFLKAALEIADIRGFVTGAAQPKLNQANLKRIPIPLPPKSSQRVMGGLLRGMERLIENNRRRIEILAEMARLMYREWFVHFRYPGHENVELVDSHLGPIPEGWEIEAVGDVAELVRGRSYRGTELVEAPEGRPFLNLKCFDRGGGFRKSGLKRYNGAFKEEQRALSGDTVIAVTDMTQERNIVAQAARVPCLPEGAGIISLDLARVMPRDAVDGDYLYAMFRHSSFSSVVKEHANGTNVLHLSPDRIREFRFVAPPVELQKSFGDVVRPMYDLVDNLELQSETLAQARGLLLPRLVSGALDVSDLDVDLEPVP